MFRRLVQRRLSQLQLLPEGAGALGEPFEALRPCLQRRDGSVHFPDAALRPLGGGDRRWHQFLDAARFVRVRRQRLEALVGAVHPGQQPTAALLELPAQRGELREPGIEILDHLATSLDLRHRLGQPVGFGPYHLDGRLHLLDRRQLGTQAGDRVRGTGQPRLRAGLALPHAGDLALGDLHLLDGVLHRFVGALEARHVLQDGRDARLRLLEPLHPVRHVLHRLAEPAGVRFDRAHALGLRLELGDGLADGCELRGRAIRTRPYVGDRAARLVERPIARLHVRQPAAQVDDALADGIESLILQLEPLHRALHLVAQRGEAAAELLIRPFRLVVPRGDQLGMLQHVAVHRLEVLHPGFQLVQRFGVFFVLADLGVDLAREIVEPGHLCGNPLYGVALLLERRDLLRDRVGERLEGAELAGSLGRIGGGLLQILEGLSQGGDPRLRRRDAGLDLLLPLLERVQPGGHRLAGATQLLLTLAHAVEALRDVADVRRQFVGVHAQRLEPAAQLEKAGEVVLQGQRLLERTAQLFDLAAQPFRVFRVGRNLRFGTPLDPGDCLGLLVQRRQHRRQPLQRLDAALQVADDFLGVGDRLGERGQILGGFPRRVGQGLERHPLPLHLRENRAEVRGELLRRRFAPEQLPGHGLSSPE